MKQRNRKRWISVRASPVAKTQHAVRKLTEQDRAALLSMSESGLFTLEASRRMYAGVRRLRTALRMRKKTMP